MFRMDEDEQFLLRPADDLDCQESVEADEICRVMETLLNLRNGVLRINDNFFEWGGDLYSALNLADEIGVKVTDVLASPSPLGLIKLKACKTLEIEEGDLVGSPVSTNVCFGTPETIQRPLSEIYENNKKTFDANRQVSKYGEMNPTALEIRRWVENF